MPGATVNAGTGTTVLFLSSGFTALLTRIMPWQVTVQTFRTTHMSSPKPTGSQQGGHRSLASMFGDMGELEISGYFNPQTRLPDSGVFETVLLFLPLVPPDIAPVTWMGSACMTFFQPTVPVDNVMGFEARWKWSGIPLFEPAVPAAPGPVATDITVDGLANVGAPVVFSLVAHVTPGAGRTIDWATLAIAPLNFVDGGTLLILTGGDVEFTPDPAWPGAPALLSTYSVSDDAAQESNAATITVNTPGDTPQLYGDFDNLDWIASSGAPVSIDLAHLMLYSDGEGAYLPPAAVGRTINWATLILTPTDTEVWDSFGATIIPDVDGMAIFNSGTYGGAPPTLELNYTAEDDLGTVSIGIVGNPGFPACRIRSIDL
jgi:hypothetical protein